MAQIVFTAENGSVALVDSTILFTPDLFGTWETNEDVLLSATIPETFSTTVSLVNGSYVPDEYPAPPVITSGKFRIRIEPSGD